MNEPTFWLSKKTIYQSLKRFNYIFISNDFNSAIINSILSLSLKIHDNHVKRCQVLRQGKDDNQVKIVLRNENDERIELPDIKEEWWVVEPAVYRSQSL